MAGERAGIPWGPEPWPGPDVADQAVDLLTPAAPRVYDALLGGKDNYSPDRKIADRLVEVAPSIEQAAREPRIPANSGAVARRAGR